MLSLIRIIAVIFLSHLVLSGCISTPYSANGWNAMQHKARMDWAKQQSQLKSNQLHNKYDTPAPTITTSILLMEDLEVLPKSVAQDFLTKNFKYQNFDRDLKKLIYATQKVALGKKGAYYALLEQDQIFEMKYKNSGKTNCQFKDDNVVALGFKQTFDSQNPGGVSLLGRIPVPNKALSFYSEKRASSEAIRLVIGGTIEKNNQMYGVMCLIMLKKSGNLKKVGSALHSIGINVKAEAPIMMIPQGME